MTIANESGIPDSDEDARLLETLTATSDGLLFSSESDYPFEPFLWHLPNLTPETLLSQIDQPPDTPVESVSLEYFFRNVATPKDWHDDRERAMVDRYQALIEVLQTQLCDLQVYRVGQVEIQVYIVGRATEDALAGLMTTVIET